MKTASGQHRRPSPRRRYRLSRTPDAANAYWGFTAMRRWQVLHREWGKLYLGLGANYRSETDYLESTRWNFST
jgi:hypothetical protein